MQTSLFTPLVSFHQAALLGNPYAAANTIVASGVYTGMKPALRAFANSFHQVPVRTKLDFHRVLSTRDNTGLRFATHLRSAHPRHVRQAAEKVLERPPLAIKSIVQHLENPKDVILPPFIADPWASDLESLYVLLCRAGKFRECRSVSKEERVREGALLKAQIKRLGIQAPELAKALNIHVSVVDKWKSGRIAVRSGLLELLAASASKKSALEQARQLVLPEEARERFWGNAARLHALMVYWDISKSELQTARGCSAETLNDYLKGHCDAEKELFCVFQEEKEKEEMLDRFRHLQSGPLRRRQRVADAGCFIPTPFRHDDLNKLVRETRARMQVPQDIFAEHICVNPQTLGYWETGEREVHPWAAERIQTAATCHTEKELKQAMEKLGIQKVKHNKRRALTSDEQRIVDENLQRYQPIIAKYIRIASALLPRGQAHDFESEVKEALVASPHLRKSEPLPNNFFSTFIKRQRLKWFWSHAGFSSSQKRMYRSTQAWVAQFCQKQRKTPTVDDFAEHLGWPYSEAAKTWEEYRRVRFQMNHLEGLPLDTIE
ncbi:MAG: hypothetical protein HY540_05810 [Deltaproteobacteria bacterium]|nr:hypothetical protein [Deltaproteobacteria bacterium]